MWLLVLMGHVCGVFCHTYHVYILFLFCAMLAFWNRVDAGASGADGNIYCGGGRVVYCCTSVLVLSGVSVLKPQPHLGEAVWV